MGAVMLVDFKQELLLSIRVEYSIMWEFEKIINIFVNFVGYSSQKIIAKCLIIFVNIIIV